MHEYLLIAFTVFCSTFGLIMVVNTAIHTYFRERLSMLHRMAALSIEAGKLINNLNAKEKPNG